MITKLNHLLENAQKKNYAVAGFNVSDEEEAKAVIFVAEKRKESVVLQYCSDYEKVSPIDTFGPNLVKLANKSCADIALMFQHEKDLEIIKKALKMGFNSVMYDVSKMENNEAVDFGKKVVDIAKMCDSNIEVRLGGLVDTYEKALDYIKQVDVDCLACGMSDSSSIDIESIRQIKKEFGLPLVMHMTKLLTLDQIRESIQAGVRKVNFYFDKGVDYKEVANQMMALVSSK